jgi:hypothetical protein
MTQKMIQCLMVASLAMAMARGLLAHGQIPQGAGKSDLVRDFILPDYYPSTNGVRRLKTRVVGAEARFVSNGVFALKHPRIESYREDGATLEWVAVSPECIVNMKSKVVYGRTNMFFHTADEQLFLSGSGFLWQQTNSVLILSNETRTWIDKQAMTNTQAKLGTNR